MPILLLRLAKHVMSYVILVLALLRLAPHVPPEKLSWEVVALTQTVAILDTT